jgi:hypothetical protein
MPRGGSVPDRRFLGRIFAFFATASLALAGCNVATGGCGDDLDGETVTFAGGAVEDGIYTSSSWDALDRLEFPPGLTIRFEHGLGRTPRLWQAYVSTAREGLGEELVLASGNEAELVEVDDEAIALRNGTCADLYLVVVAMSDAPGP